jgi:integrase/recombinase XerD
LTLLTGYGLRAGEITGLRLEDVGWRSETLRIRHSKTSAYSELPLLPEVGNAILDYLRKGRPKTPAREIFIRTCAPYRALKSGSSLHKLISLRLNAAGIDPQGRRGPHAFRHARAISMLRAGVPIKEIGDVLGHRSADSTNTYLKLASEDLRAVALEIPVEVNA